MDHRGYHDIVSVTSPPRSDERTFTGFYMTVSNVLHRLISPQSDE